MESLGFGARLWLAFVLPWKVLFDGVFAAKVHGAGSARLEPALAPVRDVEEKEAERDLAPALQLLSILQREGRFVDFVQEDLSGASDADIGAAARVVHEGCRKGLQDYVEFEPVRSEDEGATVELAEGFDAVRHRVTGNVKGEPPYAGTLAHHGWQASRFSLPKLSDAHDPMVVAPAEVEL